MNEDDLISGDDPLFLKASNEALRQELKRCLEKNITKILLKT